MPIRNVFQDLLKKTMEIKDGYTNLIFKKERIEEIAARRGAICANCGELNKAGFYLYCDLCCCYMPAKLRSPESECKIAKWGKETLDDAGTGKQ